LGRRFRVLSACRFFDSLDYQNRRPKYIKNAGPSPAEYQVHSVLNHFAAYENYVIEAFGG
jgi:hypothetical protein